MEGYANSRGKSNVLPALSSARGPRALVALVAGALALTLAGCGADDSAGFGAGGAAASPAAAAGDEVKVLPPAQREPAPDISGTTLQKETLSLDSYRGTVVVLNFWASWCAPCRDEVPDLKKVNQRMRDRGVRVVGVNTKDRKASAKAFVRNFDIEYPSIYDQPGRVALAFRGTIPPSALPSTIVIDRQGRVAARIIGESTYSQLKRVVTRVADSPTRPAATHAAGEDR